MTLLSKEEEAIYNLYIKGISAHIASKLYVKQLNVCIDLIKDKEDHTEAYSKLPALEKKLNKANEARDKQMQIIERVKNGERL